MIFDNYKHLSFVPMKDTGLISNKKDKDLKTINSIIENDKVAACVYKTYGFYNKCNDYEWGWNNWLWVTEKGNILPWWKWQEEIKWKSYLEGDESRPKYRFKVAEHIQDYDPKEIDDLLAGYSLQKYYTKILMRGEGLGEKDWKEFSSLLREWNSLDPIERETIEHLALSNKKTYEEIYTRMGLMINYNRIFQDRDPLRFITFTFSDDYLTTNEDGSKELRPFVFKRVQKFASLYLGPLWIINEDYGDETNRPHLHGVFNSLPYGRHCGKLSPEDLEKIRSLFLSWFPGCINGLYIEAVNISTPDLKKLSHYVVKLSHHATKTSARKGHRLMYSKELSEMRKYTKQGEFLITPFSQELEGDQINDNLNSSQRVSST